MLYLWLSLKQLVAALNSIIFLSVEISLHPRNFQYVSLWCTVSPLFDNMTDWTSLFNNEGVSSSEIIFSEIFFFTPTCYNVVHFDFSRSYCIGEICAFLWTWEVFRWKWTFSKIHIWTRFFSKWWVTQYGRMKRSSINKVFRYKPSRLGNVWVF